MCDTIYVIRGKILMTKKVIHTRDILSENEHLETFKEEVKNYQKNEGC